ncbi:hypothetical protein MTR_1g072620 [Medicago truncatula]|uniref:Uncharacterized protein n=1 Tax=Medicago truncatula TaxID=3880 RepID=G7IEG8_MEDTR|nr:hypothetical protein MTR_1g072620 [Medicago truncatula]
MLYAISITGHCDHHLNSDDNTLLRVNFVREVDELLQEVCSEHDEEENEHEFSPDTVANRLKQQEKQQQYT